MKKYSSIIVAGIAAVLLTACTRPHPVDEIKEVGASETAFLVALDGDTLKNQSSLKSVEFLESAKISGKRIVIPHKIIDTCKDCFGNDHLMDVPTVKLYTINRAPVARSWTASPGTGTSINNQAFSVESSESIDYDIGATMLAHINEADTAKYLYLYSGVQLEKVIDNQVRTFVSAVVSREMGSHPLDWNRLNKNAVFTTAFKETKEFFSTQGITIDTLGYTEGMNYHDPSIQKAINAKFAADINVEIASKTLEAANKFAQSKDAVQAQQAIENRKRELDNNSAAITKWNGVLPSNMAGAIPFINIK